jgi:hypothetical protein
MLKGQRNPLELSQSAILALGSKSSGRNQRESDTNADRAGRERERERERDVVRERERGHAVEGRSAHDN